MHRLLFEKTGEGVWLSHLDLMRAFQRSFSRAGLLLKHSQGFSPRPYVSVALPLSVGTDSVCELLDFELEDDAPVPSDLPARLNRTLPAGVRVQTCYDSVRKIRDLVYLSACVTLEYDRGIPENAQKALEALFARESLVVLKRTKGGEAETEIRQMIRRIAVRTLSEKELCLDAVVCAQNPSLNPALLVSVIERYAPELTPDFFRCSRVDILDAAGESFR